MTEQTTLLIVDDHPVIVEGLQRAIENEPDFQIVGVATDGIQAIEQVKSLDPDLVILDVDMPNLNGLQTTHQIRNYSDRIRIVVFTMYSDLEYVTELFQSGVSAYVLKDEPLSHLVLALRAVRAGDVYYSKRIHEKLRHRMKELALHDEKKSLQEVQDGIAKLSAREKEVFLLLADGFTSKEIAVRLHISPKTAETHKYNIMEKLNVRSVAQLTKMAVKKNLIQP